ncbi:MAG: hypothetical protein IJM36_03065 [Acholeplasmatales bacterium]|nr:hypothetical protein [Acholeplasmatales bacterium]
MKKAIISLAALAFTGVVLASCSNSSIKAPKKGKAVESIELTKDNNTISFNKSDSFDDVFGKIYDATHGTVSLKAEEESFSFKQIETLKSVIKKTNAFDNNNDNIYDKVKLENSANISNEVYAKMHQENENDISAELYTYEGKKTSIKVSYDKYKEATKENSKDIVAGYMKFKDNKYSIDGGNYVKNSVTYTYNENHMNNKEKVNDEEYTYLNDSITVTPPDYSDLYKNYVAYKGDKKYSYNYSNYLPVESYQPNNYSLYLSDFYEDEYKDFYETSFELTDKEIILKTKTHLTYDLFNYYYEKKARTESTKTEDEDLHDIIDNEYKGSYIQREIWISYDTDFDGFTYSYFSEEGVSKTNIEFEWTKEYIETLNSNKLITDAYIGKKYTEKGNSKSTHKIIATSTNYNKKIDSFIKKAKKNNAFEGLHFYK